MLAYVNANHERKKAERIARENKRKNIIATVVCTTTLAALFMLLLYTKANQDYTYAIASDNYNGVHYEYVTDRVCTVTEINGDLVTVETKNGNLYKFYGDGYEVDDTIICTFNSANEIINAE
jgi:hypothetical protein